MLDIKKVFFYDQNTEDQSTGEITQSEVDFSLPPEELLSLADSLQEKADRMLESYRLSDSEQLYKTILKIREKLLGEQHNVTASTYLYMSIIYLRKGDLEKSGFYSGKYENIKFSTDETDDTNVNFDENHAFSDPYMYDNSTGEVENIEIDYTLPKEQLLSLADSLQEKADSLLEEFCLSDSEKLFDPILKIREKYLGENHPDTAVTYFSLGRLSNRKGMFKDSIDYYKKAIKINEEAFGQISIENWEIYNYLETAYSNIGDEENLRKVNQILDTLKNELDL